MFCTLTTAKKKEKEINIRKRVYGKKVYTSNKAKKAYILKSCNSERERNQEKKELKRTVRSRIITEMLLLDGVLP